MILISLSIVVIVLFIAVLAIFLTAIGVLLNRTADNLGDCLQSLKTIAGQADVIGPAVEHINRTGKELVGALPLLYEAAESINADPAPPAAPPSSAPPSGLGYLDA
ncbi:MAG: hypothetical protein ACRDSZ_25050 [Pseudonocardiaceae bacterium]